MIYNIGDKIRCLPGFNNDSDWISESSGGAGYKDGDVLTVKRVDKNKGYNEVLWFEEFNSRGIFSQAVTLYNDSYEIF